MTQHSNKFVFVRASQRIANRYKVKGAPALVFVDPDGQVIHQASVASGPEAVKRAFAMASEKYASKPVTWENDVRAASTKKLLVVGFDTGEGKALKVFEEPALAKYQDKLGFVKMTFEKGSDLAKRWRVYSAPTLLICDPSQEDPAKKPLAKLQGKKSLASVRAAVLKSLMKVGALKQ